MIQQHFWESACGSKESNLPFPVSPPGQAGAGGFPPRRARCPPANHAGAHRCRASPRKRNFKALRWNPPCAIPLPARREHPEICTTRQHTPPADKTSRPRVQSAFLKLFPCATPAKPATINSRLMRFNLNTLLPMSSD